MQLVKLPPSDQLLSFLVRYVQDAKRGESIDVPFGNRDDYLILFGLFQRTRRFAAAYLRLHKKGFQIEGIPIVRAALEHAVTAQWCYLTIDGISRLNSSMVQDQINFAVAMKMYSPSKADEWDQYEKEARNSRPDGRGIPPFSGKGLINQIDSESFLASSYKVFSQVTHVSSWASIDHVSLVEDKYVLRKEPVFEIGEEILYTLAVVCMLAAWVQAHLEEDTQELRILEETSKELSLPCRLDFNLDSKDRRFPGEDSERDPEL